MSGEDTPKVDFKDRQKKFVRWLWIYLFPILLCSILISHILFLFLIIGPNKAVSVPVLLFVGLFLVCILLFFISEHQTIYMSFYNLWVHKCWSGLSLVLAFCFVIAFPILVIFLETGLLDFNEFMDSFALLCGLLVFIAFWELYREVRRERSLRVYPKILASAERDTNEYLDGYSPRPVELEFDGKDKSQLFGFARFLLRHELIIFVREETDSMILFFPVSSDKDSFFRMRKPTGSGWRLFPLAGWGSWLGFMMYFKLDPSYIRFFLDGRAEVYVTRQDYDFLKAPISYHLFCQKLVERMKEAYDTFVQGDEKGTLEVFRVEKHKDVIN